MLPVEPLVAFLAFQHLRKLGWLKHLHLTILAPPLTVPWLAEGGFVLHHPVDGT
jgi:hypothetical protein